MSICALFPFLKERVEQVKKIKHLNYTKKNTILYIYYPEKIFRELTIWAGLFFVLWNDRTLAEEIF